MSGKKVLRLYERYVMPTYATTPLVVTRAKGIHVWDADGKKYLDFFPGWGVGGIGHSHPMLVAALKRQVGRLIHVPNNYFSEEQGKLAEAIVRASFPGKVFFCNSGAEANEGAIKIARKHSNPERYEIITMTRAFHGRTIATVTATGQQKYLQGFEPLPGGFKRVPFNDLPALKSALTPQTAAVMLEPIQGEGGINVADQEYLTAVRKLCDEKGLLLIFDEVQTGMGRTGKLFCYQNYGVTPDIMTLSKALGSGFPIGAVVAGARIADTLQPGTHGTTFGGSPLACSAALATFEAIKKEKLLQNAIRMGAYLRKGLLALQKKHSIIREVRGMALMQGVGLSTEGKPVYLKCLQRGLLINCTQGSVLRIMPPLTVTKRDIDKALSILDEALG